MEGLAKGTEPPTRGTPKGKFSCKAHTDLSLRMTKGYMWKMIEEDVNTKI
jgi:hypothetical protein